MAVRSETEQLYPSQAPCQICICPEKEGKIPCEQCTCKQCLKVDIDDINEMKHYFNMRAVNIVNRIPSLFPRRKKNS